MRDAAMLAAMMLASAGPMPTGYRFPSGGIPRMGSPRKQQGGRNFLMGERERQRRAWRQAVDEAAARYGRARSATKAYYNAASFRGSGYGGQALIEDEDGAWFTLYWALTAPKPWRKA